MEGNYAEPVGATNLLIFMGARSLGGLSTDPIGMTCSLNSIGAMPPGRSLFKLDWGDQFANFPRNGAVGGELCGTH